MSKLVVFIVVLVSGPLNIKIRYVEFLHCLLLWDSSCARNSCNSHKNEKDCWEVFYSLSESVFHFQNRAAALRSALQSRDWGCSRIHQTHQFSWQCVPGTFRRPPPCKVQFVIPSNLVGAKGSKPSVWSHGCWFNSLIVQATWWIQKGSLRLQL